MTTTDIVSRSGLVPPSLRSFRLHPDPDGSNTGGATGGDSEGKQQGSEGDGRGTPDSEKITLSRSEYDKLKKAELDLGTVSAERDAYKTDWSHAERLLKPSDDPEQTLASVRHTMKKAGYTEAQINAYVESMTQKPKGGKKGQQEDEEEDQEPSEVQQLSSRLESTEKQMAEQERKRLASLLNSEVTTRLDKDPEIGNLIKAFVRAEEIPEEDLAKRNERESSVRTTLFEEVEQRILGALRQRHAQSRGGWDDRWISEEAVKAVKAVYGKYRGLVGDPSRLGRAPETEFGADRFANLKPVPAPTHKRGTTIDQASSQVRTWALDKLSREAAALSRDGASVV